MLAGDQERIFLLLSFICPPEPILRARDSLARASGGQKAYALEMIDVLAPKELNGMLMPLMNDLPLGQKAQQLQVFFPFSHRDRAARLAEILAGPDGRFNPWSKACALYAIGKTSSKPPSEMVISALSSADPLVREMAVWALAGLADAEAHINALLRDCPIDDPRLVEALQRAKNGGGVMLQTTVEKVIALKKVSIFADTPDEILAEIASLLEEMTVSEGETLFEKGDPGDCMFILVEGQIFIHDGERILNRLGGGDIFGEMAVLDVEPRMATATAVKDSYLLRLDQELLYELMEGRIEVARGIIHVLSRRLRVASTLTEMTSV
jgi:hypothetical protein